MSVNISRELLEKKEKRGNKPYYIVFGLSIGYILIQLSIYFINTFQHLISF
jgi:hypothetical protein